MANSGDKSNQTPIEDEDAVEDPAGCTTPRERRVKHLAVKGKGRGKPTKTPNPIGTGASSSGPALILPKDDWLRDQRVNIHCKTKILETLMQKMTETQKEILEDSFVNNFINLPTKNFPTQLLLQLLRRRVESNNKRVLKFNLEGRVVEFTIQDFELLTGLNCGEVRYVNIDKLPRSTLETGLLKNYRSPKFSNLKDKIEEYDFSDDSLSLKIAKLSILESIIVARLPGNKMDTLHLRLVEDSSMFESYPWGRVAFNHLVQGIENSVNSQMSTSMTVTGFAYALIYWAYEIIPRLSENERYGKRIGNGIPRIMNWDIYSITDGRKLERDIFNDKIEVVPMEPNEDEIAYIASTQEMHEEAGKGKVQDEDIYGHDEDDERNIDNEGRSRSSRSTNEAAPSTHVDKESAALREIRALLVGGFASMTEKMREISAKLDTHLERCPDIDKQPKAPEGVQERSGDRVVSEGKGVDDDVDSEKEGQQIEGGPKDLSNQSEHQPSESYSPPDLEPSIHTTTQTEGQETIAREEDVYHEPHEELNTRPPRSIKPGVYGKEPYTNTYQPPAKRGRGAGASTRKKRKR